MQFPIFVAQGEGGYMVPGTQKRGGVLVKILEGLGPPPITPSSAPWNETGPFLERMRLVS